MLLVRNSNNKKTLITANYSAKHFAKESLTSRFPEKNLMAAALAVKKDKYQSLL